MKCSVIKASAGAPSNVFANNNPKIRTVETLMASDFANNTR
jgi:hypothetical protein